MITIKRIILALLALAMPAALLTAVAAPAQAYSGAKVCQGYGSGIDTCVSYEWEAQNDGDGIVVRAVHVTTPNGCGSLEGNGTAYHAVFQVWNDEFTSLKTTKDWGYEGCNFSYYPSAMGPDSGPAIARMLLRARRDFAGDKDLAFNVELRANGTFSVNGSSVTDPPCCGSGPHGNA